MVLLGRISFIQRTRFGSEGFVLAVWDSMWRAALVGVTLASTPPPPHVRPAAFSLRRAAVRRTLVRGNMSGRRMLFPPAPVRPVPNTVLVIANVRGVWKVDTCMEG